MRRVAVLVLSLCLIAWTADAKTLYVNAATGNDATTYANNDINNPWASLCRATNGASSCATGSTNASEAAAAGDTVIVAAGTYSAAGTATRFLSPFNPANSGTNGSPITIRCGTANGCTAALSLSEGPTIGCRSRNYIVWDDWIVNGTVSPSTSDTGHVDFYDATGCELLNSTIQGDTNHPNTGQGNYNGVRLEATTSIRIAGNEIYDIAEEGVYGGNQACIMTYDADSSVIELNDLHDCGVGVYLKGTHDTPGESQANNVIRLNRVYDVRADGIEIGSAQGGSVYQNTVSCGTGSTSGIRIQSWAATTNIAASPHDFDIYNNGVIGCDDGMTYASQDNSTAYWSAIRVYNNIFMNGDYGVHSTGPTSVGDTDHQHNIYHQFATAVANFGSNLNLAGWQALSQDDTAPAGITSDPTITSETAETEDWHLVGGSPAIDLGRTFGGGTVDTGPYITGSETIGDGNGATSSSAPVRLRIRGEDQ